MSFIDTTQVHVTAGRGGDGMMCFKKARNKPRLGPDGGNGGNGGNVLVVAETNLNTLHHLPFRKHFKAEHGGRGGNNNKTGRCGEAYQIPVPLGTIVIDHESGEQLGEITSPSDKLLIAKGGKRGYGNLHYTSSIRQAPHFSTEGHKGEHRTLRLELKLLADVGLAGFPNAGKSTLLSRMSQARPKVGDYPFTTLTPSLGVVSVDDDLMSSFVMADIPGLIEGASLGKGLGHQFLRHLERTRIIAMVIDSFEDPDQLPEHIRTLERELKAFSSSLAAKHKVIVLNKLDLLGEDTQALQDTKKSLEQSGYPVLEVSGVSGMGITELSRYLWKTLKEET